MKSPWQRQANVLDPRRGFLSGDSIDTVGESRLYELWRVRLLRGLFFAKYRRDSKKSERQREQDGAAKGGRHGDSVADDVDVRQTFFDLVMLPGGGYFTSIGRSFPTPPAGRVASS